MSASVPSAATHSRNSIGPAISSGSVSGGVIKVSTSGRAAVPWS
jgi:hypothetical protein